MIIILLNMKLIDKNFMQLTSFLRLFGRAGNIRNAREQERMDKFLLIPLLITPFQSSSFRVGLYDLMSQDINDKDTSK
jgi:hypothetical protein